MKGFSTFLEMRRCKDWKLLIGKDPDTRKIEGRRRGRQRTRWLDSIIESMDKFKQTPGDIEGQESLVCCSPWGCRESDTTE